jgi:hypothetical protein
MRFLCRFGRHAPVRTQSLLDPNDMKRRTHCRRCGAPMVREPESGWQVETVAKPSITADGTGQVPSSSERMRLSA